ncbi:dTDP-4-amino-4,6-dideoxygalactose transaminase [Flexibacter flexilis DSM 6793]|uniref:dTDP-4-amino-4,6-dideoxygalactose transaminase n=1 Tax=Flexibacter flexilis DSM 6793 TaxID=927664 RepID=A0A1I1J6F0_9BACT|nr:DegT/DnrJ/EryC1/StrS family aminotransferase [Flexibacter flexilis]SFC44179.1 dTDP-4-amino-4,6-dideoxygalactose transaminase [Flexibacter flexilis DSM 6793]
MHIPFIDFAPSHAPLKQEAMRLFSEFYDENVFVLGQRVADFEQAFAQYTGAAHCVGVGNGLDALTIALKVLGVGRGHEVILPSNAYIAALLAVSAVGARPVLVEPFSDTFNIDYQRIEEKITPQTRAIIPVHLFGQSAAMQPLTDIATLHQLWVIEDNAQAHGATWAERRTGSWGHLNATSFYPTKNLGAFGDAGALTTGSAQWAEQARLYRNYGSRERFVNEVQGLNSRLDSLQAAFLSLKIKHLDHWTQLRQQAAAQYAEQLAGLPELQLPVCAPQATHVFHLYVVRHPRRDELQHFLQQKGIQTAIHYPTPPHLQAAYKDLGFGKGAFPIAEQMAATSLSLPMFAGITPEQIAYVCDMIRRFSQDN